MKEQWLKAFPRIEVYLLDKMLIHRGIKQWDGDPQQHKILRTSAQWPECEVPSIGGEPFCNHPFVHLGYPPLAIMVVLTTVVCREQAHPKQDPSYGQ